MTLRGRIVEALGGVTNPRTGRTVIEGAMVRDLALTDDGKVRLTFLLAAQDPASLVRDVRQTIERVDGVSEVRVDVKDPSQAQRSAAPPPAAAPAPNPRALPVMEPPRAAPGPQRPAPPAPVTYPNLGRIIAISSGKGGVGKSTVATNVAVSLARSGARVGLMDADIYGPNVPRMMGIDEPPPVENERILPLEAHGVKLMSIGFMVERDAPAIWRGPIIMKVITQFLRDVVWGKLDYFLVDMPPGTGDAQLSLVQATQVHGAVIVTTPQEVAIGDALRGAKMFERVGVPVLGIVENMAAFTDPASGARVAFFGEGGGQRLADEVGVPLLGSVALSPGLAALADQGEPIVVAQPDSPAGRSLLAVAERVDQAAAARGLSLPVINQ